MVHTLSGLSWFVSYVIISHTISHTLDHHSHQTHGKKCVTLCDINCHNVCHTSQPKVMATFHQKPGRESTNMEETVNIGQQWRYWGDFLSFLSIVWVGKLVKLYQIRMPRHSETMTVSMILILLHDKCGSQATSFPPGPRHWLQSDILCISVATAGLTMLYHTTVCHTMPYHISLYHTIPHHTIHTLPNHIWSVCQGSTSLVPTQTNIYIW